MTGQNRPSIFEELVWQPDRMLLRDLVFRLQHYANNNWELGNECFILYKIKPLLDQCAKFWSLRKDFDARNLLELGMWDGGSIAFGSNTLDPKNLSASICNRRRITIFLNTTNRLEMQNTVLKLTGEQTRATQLDSVG